MRVYAKGCDNCQKPYIGYGKKYCSIRCSRLNKKTPEETRKKMSISRTGHLTSEETRKKISISNIGKKRTVEMKKRQSERQKGKKQSKETIEKRVLKLRGIKHPPRSKEWKTKQSIAHKGKKLSKETIQKIIKSRSWYKPSVETKRRIGLANSISLRGKKLSEEHKRKIGESHKGEKSHLWRGGISTETEKIRHSLESKLWQGSVKNRDSNRCQKCEENRIRYLTAHHILNFSSHKELRFAIDNGITFCLSCHKEFHKKYTVKNNTREQLEEFLNQSKNG